MAEDYLDLGFNYTNKVKVEVPFHIHCVLEHLASKTDDEYSIVMDVEKIPGGFRLSEVYRIPLQEVTTVSIDYKEDCPEPCVIHRHPDGCNSFSSTDRDYINQNFALSLLYTKEKGVFHGQYNLKLDENTFVQLDVDTVTLAPNVVVDGNVTIDGKQIKLGGGVTDTLAAKLYSENLDIDISKIQKKVYEARWTNWREKDEKKKDWKKKDESSDALTDILNWFDTDDIEALYWCNGSRIGEHKVTREEYYYDPFEKKWINTYSGLTADEDAELYNDERDSIAWMGY